MEDANRVTILKPEDRPTESRYGGANLMYQGRFARVVAKNLPHIALQVYGKVIWDSEVGKAKWQPNEHVVMEVVQGGYREILRWAAKDRS